MAITPQTLEGLSTANSYITITDFNTYHTARGNDISTLDDTKKEQLIIKAMDYIESVYSGYFKGELTNDLQSTLFPRLIDEVNVLPKQIKEAQCILALKAIDEELLVDSSKAIKSEQVGSLKVEYEAFSNETKKYNQVYNLLRQYMSGSSSSKKILRGYLMMSGYFLEN